MAGNVVNIKFCSPLQLLNDLIGLKHAICHYSYNLPLGFIINQITETIKAMFETNNLNKKLQELQSSSINCGETWES